MNNPQTKVARMVRRFDAKRRLIAFAAFDADGRPTRLPNSDSDRIEWQFNGYGMTDEKYFNSQGKLAIDPRLGYAHMHVSYDASGSINGECYYDQNDALFVSPMYRFACERTSKIRQGDNWLITTWFEDESGKPLFNPAVGYCKRQRLVTDSEINRDDRYLDVWNRLIKPKGGSYAEQRNVFDKNGFLIEVQFLDGDGRPQLNRRCGFASLQLDRTSNEQIRELRFLGAKHEPVQVSAFDIATILCDRDNSTEKEGLACESLNRKGLDSGNEAANGLISDIQSGRIEQSFGDFLSGRRECPFAITSAY